MLACVYVYTLYKYVMNKPPHGMCKVNLCVSFNSCKYKVHYRLKVYNGFYAGELNIDFLG